MSDYVLWIEDEESLRALIDTGEKIIVDFTAPSWCRPCQQFKPHFEKAAENVEANFVAVDVDKAPWASVSFAVKSVPTVKMFRDGGYVKDVTARTAMKLIKEVE